jgi:hypothetical protein
LIKYDDWFLAALILELKLYKWDAILDVFVILAPKTPFMKKIKEYFYLLPALMFMITAIVKFTTPSAEIAKSAPAGMTEKIFYLGVLQLLCTALFIIPRTMNLGFFLICSYLGGAMAVNMTTGQDAVPPAIFLALFWVSMYLKKSEFFYSALSASKHN